MRLLFRRSAFGLAGASIIFFCSCERHHPSELPQPKKEHRGKAAHSEHAAAAPSSSAAGTPVEFFPNKKP